MIRRSHHLLLPVAVSAGSFLCLASIMFFTNPIENISYAVVFFVVLFILLLSLGYLWLSMRRERASATLRSKIVIVSILAVVFVMFRSAGSLNWVDLLVLAMLSLGLLFYSSRRGQ